MIDTKLIATIPKNAVSETRVSLKVWKDKKYVDLRDYVLSNQGIKVPTKKGCAIPIEKYPELKSAFEKLEAEIKDF